MTLYIHISLFVSRSKIEYDLRKKADNVKNM